MIAMIRFASLLCRRQMCCLRSDLNEKRGVERKANTGSLT